MVWYGTRQEMLCRVDVFVCLLWLLADTWCVSAANMWRKGNHQVEGSTKFSASKFLHLSRVKGGHPALQFLTSRLPFEGRETAGSL